MTAATSSEGREPVDFVISWVNGHDEDWLALRRSVLHPGALAADAPPAPRGEGFLRHQLRSIGQHAPWVNRIHIITECAPPAWLRSDHPKIRIWRDRDINPTGNVTFNSHAVEASLPWVPALAERFVYFNDDFFINQPIDPDLYFAHGEPYAFALPCYISTRDVHAHAMLNAVDAINEHFTLHDHLRALRTWRTLRAGRDMARLGVLAGGRRIPPMLDLHLPTPLLKSVTRDAFDAERDLLERTRSSTSRRESDVAPIYYAMMWHVLVGRTRAVGAREIGVFTSLMRSADDAVRVIREPMPGAHFCINDNVHTADPSVRTRTLEALEERFATPSEYERS